MPRDFHPSEVPTMPIELDEVGQVLLKAADVIRERGHLKNALFDLSIGECGSPVCVFGAMNVAVNGSPEWTYSLRDSPSEDAGGVLARFLKLTPTMTALVRWNNSPERTASEVISALTSCAMTRKRGR